MIFVQMCLKTYDLDKKQTICPQLHLQFHSQHLSPAAVIRQPYKQKVEVVTRLLSLSKHRGSRKKIEPHHTARLYNNHLIHWFIQH